MNSKNNYCRVYSKLSVDDVSYPFFLLDLKCGPKNDSLWRLINQYIPLRFIDVPTNQNTEDGGCNDSSILDVISYSANNAYKSALQALPTQSSVDELLDEVKDIQIDISVKTFINQTGKSLIVSSLEGAVFPAGMIDYNPAINKWCKKCLVLPDMCFTVSANCLVIEANYTDEEKCDKVLVESFANSVQYLNFVNVFYSERRGLKQLKEQSKAYDLSLKVLEDYLPQKQSDTGSLTSNKHSRFDNTLYVLGAVTRVESVYSKIYSSVNLDACKTEYDALVKLLMTSSIPYRESAPPTKISDSRSYIYIDQRSNSFACIRAQYGYNIVSKHSSQFVSDGEIHPVGSIISIYPTAPDTVKAIDFILIGLRNAWLPFLLVLATATILAAATLIPAYIVQNLTSLYIPYGNTYSLLFFGLSAIALLTLSYLIQIIQGRYLVRFETITDSNLQSLMVDRLLRIKPDYIRQYSSGSLQSRVLGISQLRQTITSNLTPILTAFLSVIFNFIYLFVFSWQMSLLVLLAATILGMSTYIAAVERLSYFKSLTEIDGLMLQAANDTINGIQELRSYNTADGIFSKFSRVIKPLISSIFNATRLNDRVDVLSGSTTYILYLFLFPMAYWLANNGDSSLTVGAIIAFLTCAQTFLSSFQSAIDSSITTFVQVSTYWQRATDVVDLPCESMNLDATPTSFNGSLTVRNLSFAYPQLQSLSSDLSSPQPLIDNLSFTVNAGESLLIYGPASCGKSTLISLLSAMHENYNGVIVVSGQDLAKIAPRVYRSYLSNISQELLFKQGSLEFNLTAGVKVSPHQLDELLDVFSLAEFVESLPMKLGTVVGPSASTLPVHVKKKVMLVRAAIKGGKYIFMDDTLSDLDLTEASSALDYFTSKGSSVICTSVVPAMKDIFDHTLSLSA